MREGVPEKAVKLDTVGVFVGDDKNLTNVLKLATIIEDGKSVCRDIGGSDPERTAAPRYNMDFYIYQFTKYIISQVFKSDYREF